MNRQQLIAAFARFLATNELCDQAHLQAQLRKLYANSRVDSPKTILLALRSWGVVFRDGVIDARIIAEWNRAIRSASQRTQAQAEMAEPATLTGGTPSQPSAPLNPALAQASHQQLPEISNHGVQPSQVSMVQGEDQTSSDPMPQSDDGRKVIRELDRGAMGVVFLCDNVKLHRKEIIKQILGSADAESMIRFRNEARSLAQINHPNVVKIYDVDDAGGQPRIIIEFVPGRNLKRVIDSLHSRIPVAPEKVEVWDLEQLLRCFQGIVRGVASIHRVRPERLIHRDLKPANIMVRETGEPVVLDFGLAGVEGDEHRGGQGGPIEDRVVSDVTVEGSVLGTPTYMSPEQALSLPLTQAADVSALGKILYELLTGRVLHKGSSLLMTLEQCANDNPENRIRTEFAELQVPQGITEITVRCLQRELNDRYPDAVAIEQDLERYFEEKHRAVLLEEEIKEQRWLDQNRELELAAASNRRFKWSIGIGVAVVILVAGLLVYGLMQARDARTQAEGRATAEAEARNKADTAALADRQRLESELKQRQISDGIVAAETMIESAKWEQARDQLRQVILLDPDSSRAHQLLARCLDVLGDPTRVAEYIWLAGHVKKQHVEVAANTEDANLRTRLAELVARLEGNEQQALTQLRAELLAQEQGYLLLAVLGIDSMPDTTPALIQVQLDTARPLVHRLGGRAGQMAQILFNLFVIHQTQLRDLAGAKNPSARQAVFARVTQAQNRAFAPIDALATHEYTSWYESYFLGCLLSMSGGDRTQSALVLINRAVSLNPDFYMTLFWRQSLLRRIVNLVPNRDRQLNYSDLRLALSDLSRLKVMKPDAEQIDIYIADCLVEMILHDVEAEAVLRPTRLQTATKIMAELQPRVGKLDRYTQQQFYLSGAKVNAVAWTLNQQESLRSQARRMLQEAQRLEVQPSYYVYQRVEQILRRQ